MKHGTHLTREQQCPIHTLLKRQGIPKYDCKSHERIDEYIYADKKKGGVLYKHLHTQKTYRKRGYANHDRRGQITNRVDIEYRPIVANNRERMGDFEGDTVIGKGHKGALVTLVDRATRETKIKALPNRQADQVAQACIDLLSPERPKSITFDNGKEFAQHQRIAISLDTEVFFAKPYHSWERGTNEQWFDTPISA